jgi:hypothetical protein
VCKVEDVSSGVRIRRRGKEEMREGRDGSFFRSEKRGNECRKLFQFWAAK